MDVLMPQLGETVAEGKITKWFKSAGDAVKPGDNLFEIETDKVSMEVPSTTAGVLAEIRVPAGEVAPVGAVVAVIADGAGAAASAPPAAAPASAAPASSRTSPPPRAAEPGAIGRQATRRAAGSTDRARSVLRGAHAGAQLRPGATARRHSRHAAGAAARGGRRHRPRRDFAVGSARPHRRARRRGARAAASRCSAAPRLPPSARARAPIRSRRSTATCRSRRCRSTACAGPSPRGWSQAKQTIPHFYLTADVEIGRLLALREEANAAAPKDGDGSPAFKLSVNDLVIKAWAAALQRVPAANAVWAQDRILRFKHSDIGVAVAIEGGLLTPVIRQAELKSLSAISNEMKELAARARARKLKPDEYQGGASAISNLGMYGVREFSAIINPPQATILAVGAARRQAVETEDGGVAFVSVMSVTLSCDHRVVDGALGAELLAAFQRFVEQPVTMLV